MNFLAAERLSVSQEGRCCMEFFYDIILYIFIVLFIPAVRSSYYNMSNIMIINEQYIERDCTEAVMVYLGR
jgi:hypothetical protein